MLSNTAVVILAAGSSSRMGTAKQLLNWGKDTLLGHVINTSLELKPKEVIVVLGANYAAIKKDLEKYPVSVVKNANWEMGLGKSIACGVSHVLCSNDKYDSVLIILADQPLVDFALLHSLINTYEKNKKLIIATSYGKEKNGVPVIFDKLYFEELSNLNDDKGAKHLLEKYKSRIRSVSSGGKNKDIDTKCDYDQLYKENFSD